MHSAGEGAEALGTLLERFTPTGRRRARDRRSEAFIILVRRISALLQAGRRPDEVWTELAALEPACRGSEGRSDCCVHHVFGEAAVRVRLGADPLAGITGPGDPHHWRQLEGCLAVSRRTGIPLAQLLERLADALEEGQDVHQARAVAAAGPRSTARLLGLLPLAGLGLSALLGFSPLDLLSGPLGWVTVLAGVGLAVVGALWTRALVRAAEQRP